MRRDLIRRARRGTAAACGASACPPRPSSRSRLLVAMVLVPAGTFAGKPSADPAASSPDTDGCQGQVGRRQGQEGRERHPDRADDADCQAGQGQAGADKTSPRRARPDGQGQRSGSKASKGAKDNANKPDKTKQGPGKKTDATAGAEATTVVAAATGEPTITSDKADYAPGDKVVLTGENWQGDEPSGVQITVNDDAGKTWSYGTIVDVAKDGTIKDQFRLPDWFVADYNVTATGLDTGRVAKTWFTDASIGTYDQCTAPASIRSRGQDLLQGLVHRHL